MARETAEMYRGFEQGPIRPPSEAYSLLIRVTRNCSWNKCTFCPVYKDQQFSLRHVDNVKRDIDAIHRHVNTLKGLSDGHGRIDRADLQSVASKLKPNEIDAFYTSVQWVAAGMRSIFFQDANSLIIKPFELIDILTHLKNRFPSVKRVTSYARSHTLTRITDENLKNIAQAGLNRIHIGLESGSDEVLKMVKKGTTKRHHIEAGLKVKNAGIELSEYVMPGLGGLLLWRDHALETADTLNQINPDFIRLRTTRIIEGVELYEQFIKGHFQKCSEEMVVREILLLIEHLESITSVFRSDHMNNLLEDVEGTFPIDKENMIVKLKSFLDLDKGKQSLYLLGRGIGVFRGVRDLDDPMKVQTAQDAFHRLGATESTIESIVTQLRQGRM